MNAVRAYGHDLCIQAHTTGLSTDSQEQLWIPTLHPDSKEVDPQHEIWMCHWPVEHLHQTHQEWNMFFLLQRCTDTQTWAVGPQSAHPRSWEFLRASLSRNWAWAPASWSTLRLLACDATARMMKPDQRMGAYQQGKLFPVGVSKLGSPVHPIPMV